MATVRIIEMSQIVASLPDAVQFSPSVHILAEDDLFVCALGFEPRCLSVPAALAAYGYKSARVAILQYATNSEDNTVNRSELLKSLHAVSDTVEVLSVDDPGFSHMFGTLLATLSGSRPRVTVDISVFANRVVLKAISALVNSKCDVHMLYSEAAEYFPRKKDFDLDRNRWRKERDVALERGVAAVSVSVDYPGRFFDPQPDYVIVFPSFTAERAWAVLDQIDPSLLTGPDGNLLWVIGDPLHDDDKWRKEAVRINHAIASDVPQIEVSTFDYKQTLIALDRIRGDKWQTHNLTIVPLGSKLQAVGIGLFCHVYRDVRLMFAIPKRYNAASYSNGCRAMWEIAFGPMEQIRRLMSSIGNVVIED